MPINVVCGGCKARFQVSEKFAGKKGPCPKCKQVITIPAVAEEIVIHEPEHSEVGAKTAAGAPVLKPIERKETVLNPTLLAFAIGAAVVVLAVALVMRLRGGPPTAILYIGALVLAPPLALAGYFMFRNDEELDGFRGLSLWIRTAICSVGYAALWWLFSFFFTFVGDYFGSDSTELVVFFFTGLPFMFLGAGIAFCCYDLELGNGFFHYALYFLVTVGLRLIMGLPVVGSPAPPPEKTTVLLQFVEHTFGYLL